MKSVLPKSMQTFLDPNSSNIGQHISISYLKRASSAGICRLQRWLLLLNLLCPAVLIWMRHLGGEHSSGCLILISVNAAVVQQGSLDGFDVTVEDLLVVRAKPELNFKIRLKLGHTCKCIKPEHWQPMQCTQCSCTTCWSTSLCIGSFEAML